MNPPFASGQQTQTIACAPRVTVWAARDSRRTFVPDGRADRPACRSRPNYSANNISSSFRAGLQNQPDASVTQFHPLSGARGRQNAGQFKQERTEDTEENWACLYCGFSNHGSKCPLVAALSPLKWGHKDGSRLSWVFEARARRSPDPA